MQILSSFLESAARFFTKKWRDRGFSSDHYWKSRYSSGGNSGAGAYNHLALFKAEILNRFVAEHSVNSVVEFGCGDGNQLRYATYATYIGYDISPDAVDKCRHRFADDASKRFALLDDYDGTQADMSISLDVVYHLVEDDVFDQYMKRLFDAAARFVIVYSSNTEEQPDNGPAHVRHRKFTHWVSLYRPNWKFIEMVPNRYPYDGDYTRTSFSDFYFYERMPNK